MQLSLYTGDTDGEGQNEAAPLGLRSSAFNQPYAFYQIFSLELSSMPTSLFVLPQLPEWTRQLANVLPLAVFVEFIDVSLKLHVFELDGLIPLWSWPITPKDARILLSNKDTSAACCLDRPESGRKALQCIDGRYGDYYQSNASATVRLCVSTLGVDQKIRNESRNLLHNKARMQRLDFLHISQVQVSSGSKVRKALFGQQSVRYCLVSSLGWLLWIAVTCFSFLGGVYFAAAYLVLMPLSGVMAFLTHGGEARTLDCRTSEFTRLVLAADSLNATEWWSFYGGSRSLNSLLRRPLYREAGLALSRPVRLVMQTLILGQWVLAIASCAKQDWNALVIAFWVFWCAFSSEYGYAAEHSIKDWLKYSCNVRLRRIQASFSSRKAMLGALVYLNPDTVGRRLQWINHIFEDGSERREWETALLDFIETGSCNDDTLRDKPCWGWIEEGVEMGRKIAAALQDSEKSYLSLA